MGNKKPVVLPGTTPVEFDVDSLCGYDVMHPDLRGDTLGEKLEVQLTRMLPSVTGPYDQMVTVVPLGQFIEWIKYRGMADKGILLSVINKKIDDVREISKMLIKEIRAFRESIPVIGKDVEPEQRMHATKVINNMLDVVEGIKYPEYYSIRALEVFINTISSGRRKILIEAAKKLPRIDTNIFREPMRAVEEQLTQWEENHSQLAMLVVQFGSECRWLGRNQDRAMALYNTYISLIEKFHIHRDIRTRYQHALKAYRYQKSKYDEFEAHPRLTAFLAKESRCKSAFNRLRDYCNLFGKVGKKIAMNGLRNKPDSGITQQHIGLIESYCNDLQGDMAAFLRKLNVDEFFVFTDALVRAAKAGVLDDIMEDALVRKAAKMCDKVPEKVFRELMGDFMAVQADVAAEEADKSFVKLNKAAVANKLELKRVVEQLNLQRNDMCHAIATFREVFVQPWNNLRHTMRRFAKEAFPEHNVHVLAEYKYWEYHRGEHVAEEAMFDEEGNLVEGLRARRPIPGDADAGEGNTAAQ